MLTRELGLPGAVLTGLGSILGTGVFVSLAIAAGIAGNLVLPAIAIAALLAMCNGLNSAQLAASHPTSGGTYEYGQVYLSPALGFAAGWMFLCAKSASAATAALGFAGYLHMLLPFNQSLMRIVAVLVAIACTVTVLAGLRRTTLVNTLIVSVTFISLVTLCMVGLPRAIGHPVHTFAGSAQLPAHSSLASVAALCHAAAIAFVAFTGYGRIATLGEEVREPARIIPRAIIATVIISAAVYLLVTFVSVRILGGTALASAAQSGASPLARVAESLNARWLRLIVSVGAVTAMFGVLLNLILGLSRVALAMGRRNDLPPVVARISKSTPVTAVLLVGAIIALLTLIGDVTTTWSFSAMTVLIYYGMTNLCAIRLPSDQRRYPQWIAWCGLIGCLGLAAFLKWPIIVAGGVVLAAGFLWRAAWRAITSKRRA